MNRGLVAAALFLLLLLPGSVIAEYEILRLAPSTPVSINNRGVAVGGGWIYEPTGQGKLAIPLSPGNRSGYFLTTITDEGVIFGALWVNYGQFAYSPLYLPREPQLLPGQFDLPLRAANSLNVAGRCYNGFYSYDPMIAACAVIDGQFRLLSFELDESTGEYLWFQQQSANSVNSQGVVVGQATVNYLRNGPSGQGQNLLRAFRFTTAGGMEDLGTLGGETSVATDINDDGTIVGAADISATERRAFFKTSNGSMVPIGNIVGTTIEATAINDLGDIIGSSTAGPFIGRQLSTPTTLLQAELHPALRFSCILRTAVDINNSRDIVGSADFGAQINQGILLRQLPDVRRSIPQTDFRNAGSSGTLAVWRPSTGTWYSALSTGFNGGYGQSEAVQWGLQGDVPIFSADFDADNVDDLVVWRRLTGNWYHCYSSNEYNCGDGDERQFGLSVDIPVPADYDGDGKTDRAVFRRLLPSAGLVGRWYIENSSDSSILSRQWGLPEDLPVPADYDGDGNADVAVFRPSTASWYINTSSNAGPVIRQFGLASDHPMPRDVDADGSADIVTFRPATGEWFFCLSSENFSCFDADGALRTQPVQYGLPGDIPLLHNPLGGKTIPLAVWRPLDNGLRTVAVWYTDVPSDTISRNQWGLANDIPAGIGIKDLLRFTGY